MTRLAYALLVCIACFAHASPARAWWNDEWAFRKELRLDLSPAGANVAETVPDAPVLVRLSLANFPYFADAKPDGGDMRVIAGDDRTPLKFHIEKFDPQAQIALLWVRVPSLVAASSSEKIYLYYGNKDAKDASDAAGSFDSDQSLVYHFGAPAGSPQDAGSYKIEPDQFSGEVNVASLIGAGVRLSGSQLVQVAARPALQIKGGKGVTVSAWVKPDGEQKSTLFSLVDGNRTLSVSIDGKRPVLDWRDGRDSRAPAAVELSGEWQHLVLRAGQGRFEILLDGAPVARIEGALPDLTPAFALGATNAGFRGEVDELQYAATWRSDGFVRAAALSQGIVAPLVVYGGDAQREEGGGESYFATTLRNVTVDGWVIIAILAVLFVASVLIMITKGLYLSAVGKGNARFLDDFNRMSEDPAVLERRAAIGGHKEDDGAAYGSSTLWQLYHHGMQGVIKRLEGPAAGADRVKSLTPQAIEALRATMDATLTRQLQRLQSQMVWLTIAIAGGPFLGLLGTVVGVMITFAAIAATGEVNINAIAPGTAAALVATVAGLSVAIPCLFGYNYLNTRVKEIGNDMRVFVDEFVTRIAETYT